MLDAELAKSLDLVQQAVEIVRRVRDRDDFHRGESLAPAAGLFDIRAVHAQDEFRARVKRRFHFDRIKAVNRDAESIGLERANRIADARPRFAGIATEIDDIGAALAVGTSRHEDRVER